MIYFDHDTGAMGDPKMTELCIEFGPGAVAAYWVILEQIYRDESPLVLFENQSGNRTMTKVVSHWLCVDVETLETWVSAMLDVGLLELDGDTPGAVTSKRATANIEAYKEKRETARQNGKKGGRRTQQKPNGNQDGTESVSGRKANKRKEKEKGFGLDKPNQKPYASGAAAAAKAAPPAACPKCGSALVATTSSSTGWWCDGCNEEASP